MTLLAWCMPHFIHFICTFLVEEILNHLIEPNDLNLNFLRYLFVVHPSIYIYIYGKWSRGVGLSGENPVFRSCISSRGRMCRYLLLALNGKLHFSFMMLVNKCTQHNVGKKVINWPIKVSYRVCIAVAVYALMSYFGTDLKFTRTV